MIIGNGLLAKVFSHRYIDRSDVTIFASGVSNSTETQSAAFEREHRLLLEHMEGSRSKFVYFGSCAVGNPQEAVTPYLAHKAAMELLVLRSGNGVVLRLPQVVGRSDNIHTLTNYLYHHIVSGEHFTIWSHAERNLIDVDDILSIASFVIDEQWGVHDVIPIAALKSTLMPHIVRTFEEVLGVKGNFSIVNKGVPFPIDTSIARYISSRIRIDLGEGYLERILQKYYQCTK
jgi:hypothetical protein